MAIDKEYEKITIKEKTYTSGVDTDLEKYYLFVYGGTSVITQPSKGKISN